MPYSLTFSDSSKSNIIVPDGINTNSTSLDLIGPGYPNYGSKIAGNFLHLLENFASQTAPINPIEGQLWYDTSDVNNKILKVMNGSTSSDRWAPTSGIYRQATDPTNSANLSLKSGDIWIDTTNQQLNIYRDNSWVLIGPSLLLTTAAGTTGIEIASDIRDANPDTPASSIIKYYVAGDVVAIFSNKTITPSPVITGFTTLTPGINLNNLSSINGVASSANALTVSNDAVAGSSFLRKDDLTDLGQVITGNIVFQQPTTDILLGSGKCGLVIKSDLGNFIQLYKGVNDGILSNSSPGSKLIFKTKGTYDINLTSTMEISKELIELKSPTTILGSLLVKDVLSLDKSVVPTSAMCDIGSVQNPFRQIYASKIGSENSIIYGTPVNGGYFLPGMIIAWGGTIAPPGWVLCNGAQYNNADYPVLAGLFNTDPTSAQFNVPNINTSSSTTGLTYIIKTDNAI